MVAILVIAVFFALPAVGLMISLLLERFKR